MVQATACMAAEALSMGSVRDGSVSTPLRRRSQAAMLSRRPGMPSLGA